MTSHANTDSTASSSSSSSTHVRKSRSKTTASSSSSPSSSTTTTTTTTTTMVPQETPHMNVLGMDGTDLDLDLDLVLDIRKPPHTNMSTTHGKSAAAAAAAADTGTGTAHFRSENAAMAASTAEEASPILPPASRGSNSSTSTSRPPSSPRRTTSRRRQYQAGTNSSLSTELVPNHHDGHRKSNWLGNLLWNKNSGNSGGDGSRSGSCAANLNVDGEQAHHDHHHDDDDDDASTQYQSLEAPTAGSHDDGNGDGNGNGNGNEDAPSSYHHHPSRPTVEDQLKQDCHFFYQGMTTSTSTSTTERDGNSNGGGLLRQRLSTRAFLHHSIPQLLSSAEGARFQAKYQRLNQDLRQTFGNGNGGGGDGGGGGGGIHSIVENDLYLDEYSTTNGGGGGGGGDDDDGRDVEEGMDFQAMTGPIRASSLSATQQLSTLIYEQNGKLLMKLPRDQMRLIMDQELEPGILSVEQWRDKSDATSANTITHHSHQYVEENLGEGGVVILEDTGPDNRSSSNTKQQQPPPLQYVMTVPDDLYRRVVSEMSNSLAPPCWGFFKCCSDTDGRADIKLALGILCVTFLLMFISTMEWPTE